jgi:hypothetical protein
VSLQAASLAKARYGASERVRVSPKSFVSGPMSF